MAVAWVLKLLGGGPKSAHHDHALQPADQPMSSTPTKARRARRAKNQAIDNDRRAPASAKGLDVTLRKIKGALGRPLALQNREGRLHVVLVDRRRAPRDAPPSLDQIRADLRTRLLVQQHELAVQVLRPLVQVHEHLCEGGWEAVGKLPADLLSKALQQALMLQRDDPSPALGTVIERLRIFKAAAEVEADRLAPAPHEAY
jgi:hypothetical protein